MTTRCGSSITKESDPHEAFGDYTSIQRGPYYRRDTPTRGGHTASEEIIAKEIIAVNDYSTDGTAELFGALQPCYPGLRVVHHTQNCGKGAALRTGITLASGDIILSSRMRILEYDPADYIQMLKPILAGKADVVYGSRGFLTTAERRVLYFWHWVGNAFLTLACNALADVNLTDMETGYKAFRAEVLQASGLSKTGSAVSRKLPSKSPASSGAYTKIGISYSGRTYDEGKKVGWRDQACKRSGVL